MYKFLDRVLKKTIRQIYHTFQKYRSMAIDELNVIGSVQEMYQTLEDINTSAYREIALHYYNSEPHGSGFVVEVWLVEVLRTPSKVMKYSYSGEVLRKRERTIESLLATEGSPAEFDKAMRHWAQMTGWFGVEVADAAVNEARREDGVETVMWVSEKDDRVCDHCRELDGMFFRLNDVPPKPHPNCRCYTVRVR